MPGYISLFQRNDSVTKIVNNSSEIEDQFDELLNSIEQEVDKNRYHVNNPKYRKRSVNTV